MNYADFINSKILNKPDAGFEVDNLPDCLFDFQKWIVEWALRKGRACIFADCGLGKTAMQLAWARKVADHTGDKVLILAPLAVSHQTIHEAEKFDISLDNIDVTNYHKLDKFTGDYAGVVLDESSILKSFDGKFKDKILEQFQQTPYKLACTATPAPNDFMELGNHAEFVGALTREEMLAMFFVHDGGETSKWRLKRHANKPFWQWVCSWAVCLRNPEDVGFNGESYKLPEIEYKNQVVQVENSTNFLFPMAASTLQERIQARRDSVADRVNECAAMVNASKEPWVIWCNLNSEGDALEKAIPDALEVNGSDSDEFKQFALDAFQGECICKSDVFWSKLSTKERHKIWRSMGISKNIIEKIEREGWLNLKSMLSKTRNQEKPITENTISQIKKNTKELQSNKGSITKGVGKNTKSTNPCAIPHGERLEIGSKKTHKKDSNNDSENIIYQSMNTTDCLISKMEDAQFVEHRSELGKLDSTLTTAIPEASSEDCFALNVTSELVNSKIVQNYSGERHCICKPVRVLISKPSIFGFGVNLQHCNNIAFVGLTDSYEQFYQAVRRCWRFGQQKPVTVHMITAETEGFTLENIKRKDADAERMFKEMTANINEAREEVYGASEATGKTHKTPDYEIFHGDCVEYVKSLSSDSIHYSIFSPPFASLYTYTNSPLDMGNCKDMEEFAQHFKFLTKELYRVMMPGRLLSFHCMNLPTSKQNHGYIGIQDFRGELIKTFQEEGFIYHSEVVIWKDPVIAMQRTKALGLLHKQIKKDSAMSRQGIPDYLVTMRKPGINPEPVEHTNETFPVSLWQRYASPVWMDINPSDTLQYRSARTDEDERHICPLQLQVIERAMELWTNPGDTVLSPFTGIGSEGFVAVKNGRKFKGSELKQSYFEQAVKNIETAKREQHGLFAA